MAPHVSLLHLAQAHVLRNPSAKAQFRAEPVAHRALAAAQGARQVFKWDAHGVMSKLGAGLP